MSTAAENVPTDDEQILSKLADRLLKNDSEALQDIFLFLGARAERVVRARLGNRLTEADYEDAVAIALAKLWDRRGRFDPSRARLDRWFYVLVRNTAVDLARHRARRQEDALGEDAERVPEPDLSAAGEESALHRDLWKALKQISEVDRRILMSGLSETDLSRELDLRPGTIRVRRLRSKQRLRAILREMGHVIGER